MSKLPHQDAVYKSSWPFWVSEATGRGYWLFEDGTHHYPAYTEDGKYIGYGKVKVPDWSTYEFVFADDHPSKTNKDGN